MNTPQETLQKAIKHAVEKRPQIGGFPFLAECLRVAGVERNLWSLPGAQSIYVMKQGVVVQQGVPLVTGMNPVPDFSEVALVAALRSDQAGKSTFPEFLLAAWNAGVIRYEVDFSLRTVSYYGARGECYTEAYLPADIGDVDFS